MALVHTVWSRMTMYDISGNSWTLELLELSVFDSTEFCGGLILCF